MTRRNDRTTDNRTKITAASAADGAELSSPPQINILIVDDEPKNLTVLEAILDRPDYRLVRAESGEQALLALLEDEFAALILDIRMPGMTGFELARLIKQRQNTANVPIIFLTAYYHEGQHVLEGYGAGVVDYLLKPVNPTILRAKVAVFANCTVSSATSSRPTAFCRRKWLPGVAQKTGCASSTTRLSSAWPSERSTSASS